MASNFFSNLVSDVQSLGAEVTHSVSNLAQQAQGNVPTGPSSSTTTSSSTSKSKHNSPQTNPLDHLPTPPELDQSTRLLLALATTAASQSNPGLLASTSARDTRLHAWWLSIGKEWRDSVCGIIKIDPTSLPKTVSPERVRDASADHFRGVEEGKVEEWKKVVETLVIASVFSGPLEGERMKKVQVVSEKAGGTSRTASTTQSRTSQKQETVPTLSYTAPARSLIFTTLHLLSIPTFPYLSLIELQLSSSLFSTLQEVTTTASEVESARSKAQDGWGGKTGRMIATGAGVVLGGVAIGVMGGLAAPAIAALIPSALSFGLLTTATAPVVLGSVLGVYGGGLAGKRVKERWRGVNEFEFVDVKPGSSTVEEVPGTPSTLPTDSPDLAPTSLPKSDQVKADGTVTPAGDRRNSLDSFSLPDNTIDVPPAYAVSHQASATTPETPEFPHPTEKLALDAPLSPRSGRRSSLTIGRTSLDGSGSVGGDELRRASLARASLDGGRRGSVASSTGPGTTTVIGAETLGSEEEKKVLQGRPPSLTATIIVPGLLTKSQTEALTAWQSELVPACFPDGRDVYVLKYETKLMYQTGKAIDSWATAKLKGYVKKQVIKRTLLAAYFSAVALPLTVYGTASKFMDNTWMQSVDKARKAGTLLGEVLEKRVQGQRPVILIGSSTGALTIFEALLYLARSSSSRPLPEIVESVYLISLPTAPTPDEWASCRSVVARRLVNAWCGTDMVLAGVVRLHEVVSRAVSLQNGVGVAGLIPVSQPGIEDVCLNDAITGHLQLQVKMAHILKVINVDGLARSPQTSSGASSPAYASIIADLKDISTRPISALLREGTTEPQELAAHSDGALALKSGTLTEKETLRYLLVTWTVYKALEDALNQVASIAVVDKEQDKAVKGIKAVWKEKASMSRAKQLEERIITQAGRVSAMSPSDTSLAIAIPPKLAPALGVTVSFAVPTYLHSLLSFPPPTLTTFTSRIFKLSVEDPGRLLAHAYVLFLGSLPNGEADGSQSATQENEHFKQWFLDSLDSTVGGDETLKIALIDEAITGYQLSAGLYSIPTLPTASAPARKPAA